LPYIEQDTVYQSIDFTQDSADKASASARALKLKVFLSVDDPVDSVVEGAAPTNYLFCAGSKPDLTDNDGLFYQESTVTLVSITDGTSNTLLAGETLKGAPVEKDTRDLRRQHVGLKKADLKGIEDDAGVKDWKDGKKIAADRCSAWIDGRFLQGTFTGTRAINDERPDVDCGGFGGLSGLRSMSDAANVSMADGSVRSVASSVNANVWKLLAGRNDGMVIPEF
jgi:prepilin-type processing-associated H-X9-DG protein